MSSEKWQSELLDILTSAGIMNTKKLNDQLFKWCKEWIGVISRMDNISGKYLLNHDPNSLPVEISVTPRLDFIDTAPFIVKIGYVTTENEGIELSIRSTTEYIWDTTDVMNIKADYKWDEDDINGIENREKEYVLSALNIRLETFLNWAKAKFGDSANT